MVPPGGAELDENGQWGGRPSPVDVRVDVAVCRRDCGHRRGNSRGKNEKRCRIARNRHGDQRQSRCGHGPGLPLRSFMNLGGSYFTPFNAGAGGNIDIKLDPG
jgi:hypothetical protein